MLRRRDHTGAQVVALQPAHESDAHAGDEVRVLAERLLEPSPARVATDVEHGPEALMRPSRAHLLSYGGGERLDERRLPGARKADRLREDRCLARHQPGTDLLVDDGRDAEPRLLDEVTLEEVRELRRFVRSPTARPRDARDLTEPVTEELGRDRREPAAGVRELEHPAASQLGHLLLEHHPPQQVVDPFLDGASGIQVARLVAVDRGRHVAGSSRRQEARSTSLVGNTTCPGGVEGASIMRTSIRTAS